MPAPVKAAQPPIASDATIANTNFIAIPLEGKTIGGNR
jgi:hypothetical protein